MWLEKLFIVYLLTLFNSMDGYNLDNHNHRSGRHRRKGWWLNTQHTTQCQRQTIESTQFVTAEEEEESWTILSTFCVRTLSKSWLSRRTCHRRAARDSIVVRRLSVSLFSFCADTMLSVSTAIIMNPLPDWNNFRPTFAAVPHLSSLSISCRLVGNGSVENRVEAHTEKNNWGKMLWNGKSSLRHVHSCNFKM